MTGYGSTNWAPGGSVEIERENRWGTVAQDRARPRMRNTTIAQRTGRPHQAFTNPLLLLYLGYTRNRLTLPVGNVRAKCRRASPRASVVKF